MSGSGAGPLAGVSDREWNAPIYDRISDPQFGWGMKVLERTPLRDGETVMDAGCGSGRLAAELLRRIPHGRLLAVDQSAAMLAEAERRLVGEFGDRVRLVRADLAALDLQAVADGVFSTATFHWVLDHERLFAGLFRALRPGGWLVAQCGGAGNLRRFHARATDLIREPPFAAYFRGWTDAWNFATPEVTAARLAAAGFVEVATDLEPAPTTFAGAREFTEFAETVVLRHHLARLPGAGEGEPGREFTRRLTEMAAADDPPFTLDYVRLNLSGRRPSP